MKEILLEILKICVLIAIPASTFVMGLEFGRPYIKEMFKDKSILIRYSLAMFIIIPFLTLIMAYFDTVNRTIWGGLFLVSIAPAMPMIVNMLKKMHGDFVLSLSWFVTSLILCLFFIPISIIVAEHIFHLQLKIGLPEVFTKILVLFLIPLTLGFLVRNFLPDKYEKIIKPVGLIGKIAMIILVLILIIIAIPLIIKEGLIAILLVIAFLIVVLIVGLIFGKPEKDKGPILASSMLLRFPASAVVLAQLNGTLEVHAPIIISYLIFGILVMVVAGKLILKKKNI